MRLRRGATAILVATGEQVSAELVAREVAAGIGPTPISAGRTSVATAPTSHRTRVSVAILSAIFAKMNVTETVVLATALIGAVTTAVAQGTIP